MGRSRLGLLYRRHRLYPRLCPEPDGRVLDIGYGIGDFLGFRPNTFGIDINERTVAWCREHGLGARLMPYDELPFAAESYDGAAQSP